MAEAHGNDTNISKTIYDADLNQPQAEPDDETIGSVPRQISEMLGVAVTKHAGKYPYGYEPKENETVAAFIPSHGGWMRGKVDKILLNRDKSEYVVWTTDYGIPWRVDSKFLQPLPKLPLDLSDVNTIYIGGLSKCSPGRTQIAFETLKAENVLSRDWDETAVDETIKLIDNSSKIMFKPIVRLGESIFGEMKITSYLGKTQDLANHLCDNQYAIASESAIPSDIHTSRTMSKMRYQNNKGQLNARYAEVDGEMRRPLKGFKSVASAISMELNDTDNEILQWKRSNAMNDENNEVILNVSFQQTIQNLPLIAKKEDETRPQHVLRFNRHHDLYSTKANDTFGSQLTIASDLSVTSSILSTNEKRFALCKKVQPMKKVREAEPLKCLPAGCESDNNIAQKYWKQF